jgi:hypothetical protein
VTTSSRKLERLPPPSSLTRPGACSCNNETISRTFTIPVRLAYLAVIAKVRKPYKPPAPDVFCPGIRRVAGYAGATANVKLTFPVGHPMGSDHCFVHSAMMRTSVGVWLSDKDMLFTQGSDLAQYIPGSTRVLPARRDILRE